MLVFVFNQRVYSHDISISNLGKQSQTIDYESFGLNFEVFQIQP
jgi:hypothetical protein